MLCTGVAGLSHNGLAKEALRIIDQRPSSGLHQHSWNRNTIVHLLHAYFPLGLLSLTKYEVVLEQRQTPTERATIFPIGDSPRGQLLT